jgi:kynurenine formamidase
MAIYFTAGVKFDVTEKALKDPNYALTVEDVKNWEKVNGEIPIGAIAFLFSNWGQKWDNVKEFLGSEVPEDSEKFNFPGFSEESAQWLIQERQVLGFVTEAVSLDPGNSMTFRAHRAIMSNQVWGIENVANLDQVPLKDFSVFVLPYKIRGGSGSPTRVYIVKEPARKPSIVIDDGRYAGEESAEEPVGEPLDTSANKAASTPLPSMTFNLLTLLCCFVSAVFMSRQN